MSLAIRIGSPSDENVEEQGGTVETISGLFYINAVEKYDISYSNHITSHPLDSGVRISDHVIMDNPVFTIQGVISGVDINLMSDTTYEQAFGGDIPINIRKSNSFTVISKESNLLGKLLPDIVGQFLKGGGYEIDFLGSDEDSVELQDRVKTLVVNTLTKASFNRTSNTYNNSIVPVTLYEFDRWKSITGVHKNLVITSFHIKEDPDSGTALFFTMVLEQFRTVGLELIDVPVEAAVSKSSKKTKDKGSVNPKTPTEEEKKVVVDTSRDSLEKAPLDVRNP